MITRIDNLFKSCLQSYFEDADIRVDYVSAPIWEFNEKDRIGTNPIMFLSLPLRNSVNTTKSGNETDNYILQLFFLKHTPFTEDQVTRTPVVDEMRALCETIIKDYIAENPLIEISSKRVYDDVYNLLDQNFSGIQVVFEFQYTDDCQPLEDVIETYGENIALTLRPVPDDVGVWEIDQYNGYTRLKAINPDYGTDIYLGNDDDYSFPAGERYLFSFEIEFNSNSAVQVRNLANGDAWIHSRSDGNKFAQELIMPNDGIIALAITGIISNTGAPQHFVGSITKYSLRLIR